MPSVLINWTALAGRSLQTATGAQFKVVRITPAHVTVRPQNGHRD